ATGRRLGEILIERGLVSGPDLTSALMDQLGVEVSKEDGFGSGLWAEIKRRHKRVRREDEPETDEPESGPAPEVFEPEPQQPDPIAALPELEQELEDIKAEYQPPSEREPEPEPEVEPL